MGEKKPQRANAAATGESESLTQGSLTDTWALSRLSLDLVDTCEGCGKHVVNGGGYAWEQCGCPESKEIGKVWLEEWTRPSRERIQREDEARQASLDRVAAFNAGWDAHAEQSTADAATGVVVESDERPLTLNDFTREVSLLDVERLPAVLERNDGAPLIYEGRFNTIIGEPSMGKTWIAIMAAIQQINRGGMVLWWDSEDRPETLAQRLQLLRATNLIGHPNLVWASGDLNNHHMATAEALEFLAGDLPGLVVIDSATSFGCPSDGADVSQWMADHVNPWWSMGHTVLLLDHVPKRRQDRPRGGIGSQAKLARIDGAALYVHGKPWNGKRAGIST